MEHGSKAPCSKPPARTKHAPPPSNSLVLRKQEFHVHRCGDWRQLCQRHSQPQGAKKNFAKNWICVSPAFERLPLAWKNKPQLGKTKKVFYCTGLHMGWKTFLLHRFAHGLESLLPAQVYAWRVWLSKQLLLCPCHAYGATDQEEKKTIPRLGAAQFTGQPSPART